MGDTMDYNSFLKGLTSTNIDYNKNLIELLSGSNNTEDTNSLLSLLRPGQVFTGEVTDIRGQMVQIHINEDQMVSAKLLSSADFVIGQTLAFQVKEKKDGVIIICPVIDEEVSNVPMQKALTAAGLRVTDKNLTLVKTLMNEQQPVDKQSLTFYLKQMNAFPNATIKTLVFMNKNHIPFTNETIHLLENYKDYDQGLVKEMDVLSSQLSHVILDTVKETGIEPALDLQDRIIQLFTKDEVESPETGIRDRNFTFSPSLREELALTFLDKAEIPQELRQMILSDKTSPEFILKNLSQFFKESSFPEKKEFVQKVFENHAYKELFKEVLLKDMFVEPKELEIQGRIKEYYKELLEKSQNLKTILETAGKGESKASQTLSDVNHNIHFMNTLNDLFAYIQLPLKLANQNAHGDLYVLRKKKVKNLGEELTAMLHLDLENLGEVNVFVRLKGKMVTSTFTLENQDAVDLIQKNLSLLTERLNGKGYQLIATVKEESDKIDLVTDFFDQETTNTSVKRYSFDVRA